MPAKPKLKGRYELKEKLGEGGMGVVYRAYDTIAGRDVALKTIKDVQDPNALDLFRKECDKQKNINHPNIVDIYDIGEFEESGVVRPCFTMPLLAGATLDSLIRNASHRLTVERSVEIICSVCKGLQAAHERGLIHRDLKPSNIFVLEDDSVKIIDFGVAHLVEQHTSMGIKGTLLYMSPEQIQMKQLGPSSDIFSLGVVCYETLTRRHPFQRGTREEIVSAILKSAPAPANELNPSVGSLLAQVVHAAIAKEPWHRFQSAREFADCLQKGMRNQPIDRFDPEKVEPRIARAQKALEEGEYDFAKEILDDLQAESFLNSSIGSMQQQIQQAQREREIRRALESARRCFKEKEFTLGHQKVQQVLDLDPENEEALRLRDSIEAERSSQQVQGWMQVSRQHLENHAYTHARQALENVLQLNPRDSRALELMQEVNHQEQEYMRVRQEKERLHQAAVDALRKGEVSSALTKLERVLELDREAPDAYDVQRSALYQKLYNEVRSEYDLLNNRLAEARRLVADRHFDEAARICEEHLAKYPGQTLFQALKFDINEAQRQETSAYIARIDREVENEPDLDRRVNLLEEALASHPNEHFRQSLEIVRAKRDLVNGIVNKAHNLEERGQFAEAQGQWEILRNIYRQYPGLDYELERVARRKEQQARVESKKRAIDQIDHYLATGDYARAVLLAGNAVADFPGDGEVAALEKAARQALERRTEAQQLVEQAKTLTGEGNAEAGLETLRRAFDLDSRNAAVRALLIDALVARARVLVESDWRQAEPLIDKAIQLDSAHAPAKSLRLVINERKRAEAVDQCLSRARELQAQGELESAFDELDKAAAEYRDERLRQLKENIRRELQEKHPSFVRMRDLEHMRGLERSAQAAKEPEALRSIFEATQLIAGQYPGDQDVQGLLETVQMCVGSAGAQQRGGAAAGSGLEATKVMAAAAPPQAAPEPPQPPQPAAAAAEPRAPRKPRVPVWVAATAGLAVLLAVGGIWKLTRRPPPPPPPAGTEVELRISPPEASVLVDGKPVAAQGKAVLAPGSHNLAATLPGYYPLQANIAVTQGSQAPLLFALQPLPPGIRIVADVDTGRVRLNEESAGEIQDGQLLLPELPPGQHKLHVSGRGDWNLEATVEAAAGQAPQPVAAISVNKVIAVLVSAFRGKGRIYSSAVPAKITWDGRPLGDTAADGLPVEDAKPGMHELVLGEGRDARKLNLEIAPAPTLLVAITSDRNVGNLQVEANEGGFDVLLNDRVQKPGKPTGPRYFRNLDPGRYTVTVQKSGFRAEPASAQVEIRKGEMAKISFKLIPLPTTATVRLRGAVPGTQVTEGSQTFEVQEDGSLSMQLEPGERKLNLHKDGYISKTVSVTLSAGQTVELGAADVALAKRVAMGTVTLTLAPHDSTVMMRRGSGPETQVVGGALSLEEGSYTFRASARDFVERTETVRVAAGQSLAVDLRLKPVPARPKRGPVGMEGWEQPDRWTEESGWFHAKGGEFALFGPPLASGRLDFTVRRKAKLLAGARVRWVLNFRDRNNYDSFEIDKGKLTVRSVHAGKSAGGQQIAYDDNRDVYQVRIENVKGELAVTIFLKNAWKEMVRVPAAGGKFGFQIPGNDEIMLSNFSYNPGE